MNDERCLNFQRDRQILVDTTAGSYPAARDLLRSIAELRRSSGDFHLYRVTEVALWSAVASGLDAGLIVGQLQRFARSPAPPPLVAYIQEFCRRYGQLRLVDAEGGLHLTSSDPALLAALAADLALVQGAHGLVIPDDQRGSVKRRLTELGRPVIDEARLAEAAPVEFSLRDDVDLRPYQRLALTRLMQPDLPGAVVLLPCGAGKTVVGVAAAAALSARTLVITPSRTVAEQWQEHFRRLTTLERRFVGLYRRGVAPRPVTVATYQALTAAGGDGLAEVLTDDWGLVIYDEVHSLPADVFRQSAALQSHRRLGLTATLVREDGRERDVFALVGPVAYAAPWRELEEAGWIAAVECVEVRVRPARGQAPTSARLLAAKLGAARTLWRRHRGEQTLVLAHRLQEVAAAAAALGAPAVTGETSAEERRRLYDAFRSGEVELLALSRVANVGVDLPAASVLIQLSGAFGSRQEEAQRVGRLLRPEGSAVSHFYSLVADDPRERAFAERRQRFLVDQGYRYRIIDACDLD